MGGRATKPLRQFPKPTTSPDQTPKFLRPAPPPVHNERFYQGELIGDEHLTEEERKEQEDEMRAYVETLQRLATNITSTADTSPTRIAPEGVKFVKNYREEQIERKKFEARENKNRVSYKTRLDKEKLHEMFHLHRENAEKWNANTLGEKYSLDPKKIEKILKFYSPLTLHMHMKE